MSNYDMDQIEREQSQKQKEQWRNYVTEHIDKENKDMTNDPIGYE